eukprot:335664-Pyramimonas_sp.AAC.1
MAPQEVPAKVVPCLDSRDYDTVRFHGTRDIICPPPLCRDVPRNDLPEVSRVALDLAPWRPEVPTKLHLFADGSVKPRGLSKASWAMVVVGEHASQ